MLIRLLGRRIRDPIVLFPIDSDLLFSCKLCIHLLMLDHGKFVRLGVYFKTFFHPQIEHFLNCDSTTETGWDREWTVSGLRNLKLLVQRWQ